MWRLKAVARCLKACQTEMPKSTKPSLRASGVGSSGAAEVNQLVRARKLVPLPGE